MKSKPRWMERVIKTAKTEAKALPQARLRTARQMTPRKVELAVRA